MSEEKDEHGKLYTYGGMLLVGVIVLILGIQELNWIISLVGLFFAGFGGFEVNLNYKRIQIEERSIRVKQSGQDNVQINQTNPQNSPTIGSIGTAYFGTSPSAEARSVKTLPPETSGPRTEPEGRYDLEELCSGQIHFEDFEDFQTEVGKGDRVAIQISAEHPVSVQIMNDDDYDSFDSDSDDNEVYWKSPKITNYGYSWPAKKRENIHILVVNETDLDEWDDEEAVATVTINAVRKKHENDG